MRLVGDSVEFCVQPASLSLPRGWLDGNRAPQPETWPSFAGPSDGARCGYTCMVCHPGNENFHKTQ